MQIFQRPIRDMRDNTDAIKSDTEQISSDLHDVRNEMQGLNKTLNSLPERIEASTIKVERVVHDAVVASAVEFGTLGLVVGLIFGLFLSRGSK